MHKNVVQYLGYTLPLLNSTLLFSPKQQQKTYETDKKRISVGLEKPNVNRTHFPVMCNYARVVSVENQIQSLTKH